MSVKLSALLILLVIPVLGQTNMPPSQLEVFSQTYAAPSGTNDLRSTAALGEHIRAECIHGRRSIAGRILRVLPEGPVVESGYTNLLRYPLEKSWLIPGTAVASRPPNLIESHEPNALCVGQVVVTDLPKSRTKPRQYDYVIIEGYPAGFFTYTSVGDVQRTVRRFSTSLEKAVKINFAATEAEMNNKNAKEQR